MKKGISLIVLVITIIVMIIIAGAIIISLNSTNVLDKANTAVSVSNEAELKSAVALAYMNSYAEYWDNRDEGAEATAKPNAAAVLQDANVIAMLAEMNLNNAGVQYTVIDTANGVAVQKSTAGVTEQL